MADGVVAEDVERTFVVILDLKVAVAEEIDEVARGLVHDKMQTGIGVGMYVEVEAYVGAVVACIEQRDGVLVAGGVVMGEQTVAMGTAPCYDVA